VKLLLVLIAQASAKFSADQATSMAAAISYYVLFSIVPLTIFAVSVFGFVTTNSDMQQRIVNGIVDSTPLEKSQGKDLVTNTLESVRRVSGPLSVLGLITAGWAASVMFGAVRRSLDTVWRVERHRPFAQQKLVDFGMMLGLGLVLLLSLASTGVLRAARAASVSFLGPLSESSSLFWLAVSILLPAVFSFLTFLGVYRWVPDTRVRLSDVWPGALLAALLFEILKNMFAFYLVHFNNYDVVYGSLGAIMVFLFWNYLTAIILLFGAEVAFVYPHVQRGEYATEAAPRPGDRLWRRALRFARRLVFRDKDDEGAQHRGQH
jgi:membrane protein